MTRSFNVRVLLAMVVLSILLGVLNNIRVYEEQRVPWLGNFGVETKT